MASKEAPPTDNDVVLRVRDLRTYFNTRWGQVKAVDGVSFDLKRGETLGIVGESGSGKSVTALSLMRLVQSPPGRIVSGEVTLDGVDVLSLSESQMEKVRGSKISIVLQDPMTSLNPVFPIGEQVKEAIRIHQRVRGSSLAQRAIDVLGRVKIPAPGARMKFYPHQMSGGMRQRVVGAIGISCQPLVLIADEPTTSLDATIQAQYLDLLREIQRDAEMSIIFITHDFGIVAKMSDRVAVMYAGRIVEQGSVRAIFHQPSHPYTRALLGSVPSLEEEVDELQAIAGQPPTLHDLPEGCAFAPRCPLVHERCDRYPPSVEVSHGHVAACWKLS